MLPQANSIQVTARRIGQLHSPRTSPSGNSQPTNKRNNPRQSAGITLCLHTHARGGAQCRQYGRDDRRYDLQRPLQCFLLSHKVLLSLTFHFSPLMFHIELAHVRHNSSKLGSALT